MEKTDSIDVYTDGGCSGNPGPGGWAFVLITETGIREFSGGDGDTTNNRMELSAVINALSFIGRNETLSGRTIEIYTDSQYVRNGITSWIHNWVKNGWKTANKKPVKNKDLWQALQAAGDGKHIRWHWVKGHAGNSHNERCDSLVRQEMAKFK